MPRSNKLETVENKDDIKYQISNLLINARKEKGMTQADLSDETNIFQGIISRLESANYNPSVEYLDKIVRALGKKLVITFEDIEKDDNETKDK